MKTTRFAIILFAIAVAALSQAQNIAGKWYGHIKIDPAMLKQVPPEKIGQIKEVEKMSPELTLKKDKSFTLVQAFRGQSHTQEGTYSFDKTTMTLNVTKVDGKPMTRKPGTQTFKIAGKTLVVSQGGATVTFTR